MSTHVYPGRALVPDYARAGGGLAISLGVLTLVGGGVVQGVAIGLALLFGGFGLGTLARHRTVTEVDEQGISTRGLRRASVPWSALDRVRLKYYSTRRDRTAGWMQLEVRGGGGQVKVDSTIDGFETIVERVAREARARDVEFDPTTATNLAALGFGPGGSQ